MGIEIVLKTNIDSYRNVQWQQLKHVPRIGEHIELPKVYHKIYAERKLPYRLEVVDVTYLECSVLVELHFDELDVKLWKDASILSMFER
jgi:hypothetical protein